MSNDKDIIELERLPDEIAELGDDPIEMPADDRDGEGDAAATADMSEDPSDESEDEE